MKNNKKTNKNNVNVGREFALSFPISHVDWNRKIKRRGAPAVSNFFFFLRRVTSHIMNTNHRTLVITCRAALFHLLNSVIYGPVLSVSS